MKTLIFSITSLFFQQLVLAQVAATGEEKTVKAPSWSGPCYDSTGTLQDPENEINQGYVVSRYKFKLCVEIEIKSVKLGSEIVSTSVFYQDKIRSESTLLQINDSVGLKLKTGRITDNGLKEYVYKLDLYRFDKENNCWRIMTPPNVYYTVTSQTLVLNFYGVGYQDTKEYFQILEGSVKFNKPKTI